MGCEKIRTLIDRHVTVGFDLTGTGPHQTREQNWIDNRSEELSLKADAHLEALRAIFRGCDAAGLEDAINDLALEKAEMELDRMKYERSWR